MSSHVVLAKNFQGLFEVWGSRIISEQRVFLENFLFSKTVGSEWMGFWSSHSLGEKKKLPPPQVHSTALHTQLRKPENCSKEKIYMSHIICDKWEVNEEKVA